MTHVTAASFPELRRAFEGYLHEDLLAEAGSPEAALAAFRADASAAERRRFEREAKRFLTLTATVEFSQVRELLSALGCRWIPPSRDALAAFLAERHDV